MDKDKLFRIYLKARGKNRKIESYADAQKYALSLGDVIAKILGDRDFTEVSEEEIAEALRPILKKAQGDALRAARLAQEAQNRAAGLGLGTLEVEVDKTAAGAVAEQLAGRNATRDYIANVISEKIVGIVDATERINIEAHDDMGLAVRIVRRYSDVGLRAGTKYAEPCQWCLKRCGSWDNYEAAKAAGAFERHPGCCCLIDYNVGKTHTYSSGGTWMRKK